MYDTGKDAITYGLDLQTGAQIWDFPIKPTIGHGNPRSPARRLSETSSTSAMGRVCSRSIASTGTLNPNWTDRRDGGHDSHSPLE